MAENTMIMDARACRRCGSESTYVIDSRHMKDGYIRRRIQCSVCQNRHTTYEISMDVYEDLMDQNCGMTQTWYDRCSEADKLILDAIFMKYRELGLKIKRDFRSKRKGKRQEGRP